VVAFDRYGHGGGDCLLAGRGHFDRVVSTVDRHRDPVGGRIDDDSVALHDQTRRALIEHDRQRAPARLEPARVLRCEVGPRRLVRTRGERSRLDEASPGARDLMIRFVAGGEVEQRSDAVLEVVAREELRARLGGFPLRHQPLSVREEALDRGRVVLRARRRGAEAEGEREHDGCEGRAHGISCSCRGGQRSASPARGGRVDGPKPERRRGGPEVRARRSSLLNRRRAAPASA
jgi:hypothetical protein